MNPRRQPSARWALPLLGLGCLLAAQAAVPSLAVAAPAVYAPKAAKKLVKLPLMPGVVVGHVNPYVVKRGDTLAWIACRFGVHPVHITKCSARDLENGMHRGQTIHVDQRMIQPAFKADTNGIVLNLPEAEVYLVKDGTLVKDYPVAVSNADWKAPIGDTRVVDMEKNPTWYIPKTIQAEMKKNGLEAKEKVDPGPNNPLGVRWIGFSDGTFGFHGTTVPTSIKHYASHGCVRFRHDDIVDLFDRVHVGTPVHVVYQPVTLAVDRKTVWISVFPDYYELGFDFKGAVKALAYEAGVLDRIDWKRVEAAIAEKDGTVMAVAKPIEPPHGKPAHPVAHPSAHPTPKPKATPHPAATPHPTPMPTPSVAPTATPGTSVPSPTAAPTERPPAPTPEPTREPTTPTRIVPPTPAPSAAPAGHTP